MQLGLIGRVRRHSVIAASIAALLATAAPAAAYEAGWGLLGRPTTTPVATPDADKKKNPQAAKARKKHRAKEFIAAQRNGKEAEKLPAGPLHIIISIKKQQMTLYAGGQPVAHSQVSTGVPGHPTPQGVFSVIEKQIYHESNLYSSAPMPYMQRITWSGVAMHQGVVPGHPASHGCIRLPATFAKRLWGITKVGARVIIAQDEVVLSNISSNRLFTALPQIVGEAPIVRLRFADNTGVTDVPLKGSIDASAEEVRTETEASQSVQAELPNVVSSVDTANGTEGVSAESAIELSRQAATPMPESAPVKSAEETSVENAIDKMVQAGADEADAAITTASVPTTEPKNLYLTEKAIVVGSVKDPMLKPGPISVYVSRKLGKLFVRKGFAEVFDAPVAIAQPDQPLGTHVFTALEAKNDGTMRWNVASLPTEHLVKKGKYQMTTTARGEKLRKELAAPAHEVTPPGSPSAALDRITIPEDAIARITELMTPGASLIISDLGMSYETGRGTDFIVLTR